MSAMLSQSHLLKNVSLVVFNTEFRQQLNIFLAKRPFRVVPLPCRS